MPPVTSRRVAGAESGYAPGPHRLAGVPAQLQDSRSQRRRVRSWRRARPDPAPWLCPAAVRCSLWPLRGSAPRPVRKGHLGWLACLLRVSATLAASLVDAGPRPASTNSLGLAWTPEVPPLIVHRPDSVRSRAREQEVRSEPGSARGFLKAGAGPPAGNAYRARSLSRTALFQVSQPYNRIARTLFTL